MVNEIQNRGMYCNIYIMNEMLFGQSKEQIEILKRDMGVALNVDESNCYVLLTGVRKQEYNQRLKLNRMHFVESVYRNLYDFMEQIVLEEHIRYELSVLNYDYSKRIIIILSPGCARYDPLPIARRISSMLEEQYRQMGETNSYFSNIMVVSSQIQRYEQIQPEFKRVMQLHDRAFFHRTSQPMTWALMEECRITYSMVEAERAIDELAQAVYTQDVVLAEKMLHQLVLGYLKSSHDCSFCQEVYVLLRQKVRSLGLMLSIPLDAVDDFPHMDYFFSIEEQYAAMNDFLHKSFFLQKRKTKCPSKLSILAFTYINQNYHVPSLSLSDVAKYIHTNTSYLSRKFKQEMGIGISEYMNRLRVEKGARLLRETNLKVLSVAKRVGIEDAHYFSSLFKRYMNKSPSAYREEHMAGKKMGE